MLLMPTELFTSRSRICGVSADYMTLLTMAAVASLQHLPVRKVGEAGGSAGGGVGFEWYWCTSLRRPRTFFHGRVVHNRLHKQVHVRSILYRLLDGCHIARQ